MQLNSIFAAFTGAKPPAAGVTPTAVAVTTPTAVAAAPAPASAAAAHPVTVAQPLEDASFAQKLLGNVGSSQNRFLQNQQLLGAVSSAIGARVSYIAQTALALLKGEAPAQDPA